MYEYGFGPSSAVACIAAMAGLPRSRPVGTCPGRLDGPDLFSPAPRKQTNNTEYGAPPQPGLPQRFLRAPTGAGRRSRAVRGAEAHPPRGPEVATPRRAGSDIEVLA